jgi:hypothetical protein
MSLLKIIIENTQALKLRNFIKGFKIINSITMPIILLQFSIIRMIKVEAEISLST